ASTAGAAHEARTTTQGLREGSPVTAPASGQHPEAAGDEVEVERERAVELEAPDHLEARAVGQAEAMVVEAGELLERGLEDLGVCQQELVAAAPQQLTHDGDRALGPRVGAQSCRDLREDELGPHEAHLGMASQELRGAGVVAIVAQDQCE